MPESYEPGQYEYHYNREERQEAQSRWLKEFNTRQSFYQRHRTIIIIFVDIIFIVVVFLIFSPFAGIGIPEVGGYDVKTKALIFEDEILVKITVEAADEDLQGSSGIRLLLSDTRDFSTNSIESRGVLAASGAQVFRMSFETMDVLDEIFLRVIIGEDEKVIDIPVESL